MIFRTTDLVMIGVMVAAAAYTYHIKHEADATVATIRKIDRDIRFEKETIDLLNADWALLTQPARLQKLSETYKEELGLQQLDPAQIGSLEEVPERPIGIEDIIGEGGADMAQDGGTTDPVMTGGVKP